MSYGGGVSAREASAVRLLDRLAARRVSRDSREDLLSRFALLAVLWSQALDSRCRRPGPQPQARVADRLNEIAEVLG